MITFAMVIKPRTRAFESVGPVVKTGRRHDVKPWSPEDLKPRASEGQIARDVLADLMLSDRITDTEACAIETMMLLAGVI